ncbi:HlyD family secretion protein [Rhodopseudomonas sp. B29]|uniref:HlyD family secretion protein n=1 Tax=Rhodopseudomonas sp. B29 TaxID=95607 RepID=UPI0003489EEF|nr:HlyD family secretion protein [Rhodopseudomonas sp. B29]
MADPVVKLAPEQKAPSEPTTPLQQQPRGISGVWRRNRRTLLLVVLPIIALIGGIAFYLSGGRYVSTDDAYVGAQKVLITPDVGGKIVSISVKEGQIVAPGDVLFQIDPVPYRLAQQQAAAKLADAKTSYENLRANVKIFGDTIQLLNAGIDLKQRDVERKMTLAKSQSGSQLDLDNSNAALVTAKAQLELAKQQQQQALNQLQGNPDLPVDQFPAYAQAKAALADAQRNLDLSTVRAPMRGTATQVDAIQLGRFVTAGTPVFSVIDTSKPWVDANPKESDFTYVAVGQDVDVDVDAFPDHQFKAKIGSLSPGTGAQFSVLPAQNATGNFVKVVQRVPVRIYFDDNDPMVKKLKAGMSVTVSIDTHHTRSLAGLFGLSSASAQPEQQ